MNRIEIKLKAREMVKGKRWELIKPLVAIWLIEAIIIVFAEILFPGNRNEYDIISSSISGIVSVGCIPLSIGYLSYVLKFVRGKKYDLKEELLGKYKFFSPIIMTCLLVGIFTTLWTLLLIIPGIIAAFSYSMVNYIMADRVDEKTDCLAVIKESKEMMQGYKWDYFVFGLSFFGWILLGILTCGILLFWLIPYMQVASTLYYEELLKVQKSKIK